MTVARAYVVTAAAGGIGSELVQRLLGEGSQVLAVDVSSRRIAALEQASATLAGRLVTMKADVTSEDAAAAIAARANAEFGTLHGLANIAGGITGIGEDLIDRELAAITLQEFMQSFELNVASAFVMTKAVAPLFAERCYGKIVNVASMAAYGNHAGMGNTAYDAAKAAVIGMTQTLSRSLGPAGVRVNVVAPGMVFTERVAASFGQPFVDRHLARTPVARLTRGSDVADVIAFLLSPHSDQVSGETIRVSGGLA